MTYAPSVGPPTLDEIKNYLIASGAPLAWADGDLESAAAAELSGMLGRLRVPGQDEPWPSALRESLCRRVAHNLAMRNLPLAVQMDDGGGTYVGGRDPEVRRLEAPYARMPVG